MWIHTDCYKCSIIRSDAWGLIITIVIVVYLIAYRNICPAAVGMLKGHFQLIGRSFCLLLDRINYTSRQVLYDTH